MQHDHGQQGLLSALSPAERVAGLDAEDLLPVLPADVLCALSEDYVRTLPPEVQDAVRARVDRENGR